MLEKQREMPDPTILSPKDLSAFISLKWWLFRKQNINKQINRESTILWLSVIWSRRERVGCGTIRNPWYVITLRVRLAVSMPIPQLLASIWGSIGCLHIVLIKCIRTASCRSVRKVRSIKEDDTSFSKRSNWQLAEYVAVACIKVLETEWSRCIECTCRTGKTVPCLHKSCTNSSLLFSPTGNRAFQKWAHNVDMFHTLERVASVYRRVMSHHRDP